MTIIVPYYAYPVWRDQNMINSPNGVHSFLNGTKDNFSWIDDLILTFETPSVEEIARAIWQRQRVQRIRTLSLSTQNGAIKLYHQNFGMSFC